MVRTGHTEMIQLYTGLVGKSGTRKTAALEKFIAPLEKWLMAHRGPELTGMPGPRYEAICTDATPEALLAMMNEQGGKGIMYTDEGDFLNILSGATYGGGKSTPNIGVMRQGIDGKSVNVQRKGLGGTIDIAEANLSLTVGMQPKVLETFASNPTLCDRGMPQRLLFFIPEMLGPIDVLNLPEESPEVMAKWEQ